MTDDPDATRSAKRLTVVTTTFGAGSCLEAYCAGVLALTNLEHIEVALVMNDPTPEERRIVADVSGRHPGVFRVTEVARESIGASINRGLLSARTPYCAFLDVDDMRVPDSFERQIAVLEAHPEADFTYGDYRTVPAQGSTEGSLVETPEFALQEFRRSCIASPTQVFRRSLIESVGALDEQFRSGGDYEFQVRAAMSRTFVKTPGLLLYYTKDPAGGSASASRLQPLERTVIELRYALYDKTAELEGYQFVEEARQYRLGEVLTAGTWRPLGQFVPGYEELLASSVEARDRLDRDLARWRRREMVRRPVRRLRGAAAGVKRLLRGVVRGARA